MAGSQVAGRSPDGMSGSLPKAGKLLKERRKNIAFLRLTFLSSHRWLLNPYGQPLAPPWERGGRAKPVRGEGGASDLSPASPTPYQPAALTPDPSWSFRQKTPEKPDDFQVSTRDQERGARK